MTSRSSTGTSDASNDEAATAAPLIGITILKSPFVFCFLCVCVCGVRDILGGTVVLFVLYL